MIITEYIAPPVPSTLYDWVAYPEGEEDITGRGPTEAEALRNLCERLWSEYEAFRDRSQYD